MLVVKYLALFQQLNRKTYKNHDYKTLNKLEFLLYFLYFVRSGYWTKQVLESIHQDFNQFWQMRKVGEHSPKYIEVLKNAVVAYNYNHF